MPQYNITSGLPDLPVGLNDKDAALVSPLYRAVTALAQQLSLLTGNIQYTAAEQAQIDQLSSLIDYREQRIYVKALVDIPYGALITISVDGGKLAASLADASILTQPAHGICDTIGGIATGEYGVALFSQGRTSGVSGTVLGSTYYLSLAGTMQLVMPTAPGVIAQVVGTGLGSAGFYLNAEMYRSGVAVAISAVAADVPLEGTGISTDHLRIPAATTAVDGYLTSTDWNTFNDKQDAGVKLAAIEALADAIGWLYNDGAGNFSYTTYVYTLPTATNTVLGGVKPDGTTITNTAGAISVTYPLTAAPGTAAYADTGDFDVAGAAAAVTPSSLGLVIGVDVLAYRTFGTAANNDTGDFDPAGSAAAITGTTLGLTSAPVTKTADFTVAATDKWLINNKAGSTCTVTMPAAASFPGRELTFHNYQAFTVVSAASNIVPQGGGAAGTAILLGVIGNWATLVSDGTNWLIMQAAPNNILLLE